MRPSTPEGDETQGSLSAGVRLNRRASAANLSGGIKTRQPGSGQRQAGRATADEAGATSGREGFEGQEP
jgi:hypothetical protein